MFIRYIRWLKKKTFTREVRIIIVDALDDQGPGRLSGNGGLRRNPKRIFVVQVLPRRKNRVFFNRRTNFSDVAQIIIHGVVLISCSYLGIPQ